MFSGIQRHSRTMLQESSSPRYKLATKDDAARQGVALLPERTARRRQEIRQSRIKKSRSSARTGTPKTAGNVPSRNRWGVVLAGTHPGEPALPCPVRPAAPTRRRAWAIPTATRARGPPAVREEHRRAAIGPTATRAREPPAVRLLHDRATFGLLGMATPMQESAGGTSASGKIMILKSSQPHELPATPPITSRYYPGQIPTKWL
jgi:hypothetical protein